MEKEADLSAREREREKEREREREREGGGKDFNKPIKECLFSLPVATLSLMKSPLCALKTFHCCTECLKNKIQTSIEKQSKLRIEHDKISPSWLVIKKRHAKWALTTPVFLYRPQQLYSLTALGVNLVIGYPIVNLAIGYPIVNLAIGYPIVNLAIGYPIENIAIGYPIINLAIGYPIEVQNFSYSFSRPKGVSGWFHRKVRNSLTAW